MVSFQEAGPRRAWRQRLTIFPTPNFLVFNEFDQAFSHELNFISTWDSPFQYIGGVYWYRERWHQPVDADSMSAQPQMGSPVYATFLGATCPGAAVTCAAPPNPTFAGSSENTAITYDSLAVFFQGSYKFNDEWKLTGAIRYTNDHKQGFQTWRVVSFNSIVGATTAGAFTPALDITALRRGPWASTQAPAPPPSTP